MSVILIRFCSIERNLHNMLIKFIILISSAIIFNSCIRKESSEKMSTYLDDTRAMTRQGKYKEALDRYIWFNEHALDEDISMAGVRASFALSYWKELGLIYPPAMAALKENRDTRTQKVIAEGNSWEYFADVVAINRTLGENSKSVELFETISEKYPKLAKTACHFVLDDLLESKRYDLIKQNDANPMDHYKEIKSIYKLSLGEIADKDKSVKTYMENSFVEKIILLIEYCLAVNDIKSAKEIQKRSLALLFDERLKNAISTDK